MTHPIRCVLATTDFSDHAGQACRRAARLAREHGARLEIAHAFEAVPIVPAWGDPGGGAWVSEEMLVEGVRARLERERAALAEANGIEAHATLLSGSIHRQIAAHADAVGADIVVMGAHGETGLLGRLLGSTTQKLLRRCHRPMLVVRTPAEGDYARLLAATDFSDSSRAAVLAAARLCPTAKTWLLHAHEPAMESRMAYARIDPALGERYLALAAAAAGRDLQEFAQSLAEAGVAATPVLRQGHPSLLLAAAIDEFAIDLLVLGAQGKSRLEAGLLGSVSQHAVAQATCDVLVVPRATPE